MRRRVFVIAVFLLLGAIVNVAAAWGCAAWVDVLAAPAFGADENSVERGFIEVGSRRRAGIALIHVMRRCDFLVSWKSAPGGIDEHVPRWASTDVSSRTPHHVTIGAGWPLVSMVAEGHVGDGSPSGDKSRVSVMSWRGGIVLDSLPRLDECTFTLIPAILPLKPEALGFVINTLIYASTLWLLIRGALALRRGKRARHGLCPSCAYPVGTSPICTECGKPVTPRSVEPVT